MIWWLKVVVTVVTEPLISGLTHYRCLGLLFHLPLIKQYLIVLFGRVQSLILFALQILFAMLRATSSFGLRPHTLSQNNTQLFCSAEYKIRKFGMTKNKTNGHAELVSASLLRP